MKLTILRPVCNRDAASLSRAPWGLLLSDYIAVDHLALHGTWDMADCMSAESLGSLARWANAEEERVKNERARRRHAGIPTSA